MQSPTQPKITPFLWFNQGAEMALAFYLEVFKDAELVSRKILQPATDENPEPMLTATLNLHGQTLHIMNAPGSPGFSMATSFFITCYNQEEVDYYWTALTQGGKPLPCGWLEDPFGVAWQVIPRLLEAWINDPDPERAGRVMTAMMKMTKIDIAALEEAHRG